MSDPAVRQAGIFDLPSSGAKPPQDPTIDARKPAGVAQSASDAADAASASAQAATDLMTQALTPPKDTALTGRPTTLLEILSRAGLDRNRLLAVTRAYWKLSTAQSDYDWAADEASRLDQIPADRGLEKALLTTAQAAAQARLHEARLGAVTAQQELADLLGVPATSAQPLAADLPLVGPYRTYFDTLFAGRVPPPRTKVIDRGLPARRDAIEARVAAVHAASTAVHIAEDARGKGQLDLPTVLTCHAEFARQRRAFLTTVRDYNLEIGEYAIAVADPNAGPDRLVAMMIVVKSPVATIAPARPGDNTSADPSFSRTPTDDLLMQPALPQSGVRKTSGN